MTHVQLSKYLVNPAKVASILDWNKAKCTIMSLDIRKNKIGIALARHPRYQAHLQCHKNHASHFDHRTTSDIDHFLIDQMHINYETQKQKQTERTPNKKQTQGHSIIDIDSTMPLRQSIENIVLENNVCAFLVHWPISKFGGNCGESCGRVLHILDELASSTSVQDIEHKSSSSNNDVSSSPNYIIHANRPFALYTSNHYLNDMNIVMDVEDNWGRNPYLSLQGCSESQFSFSSKKGQINYSSSSPDEIEYVDNFHYDEYIASTILRELLEPYVLDHYDVSRNISEAA